VKNEMGKAFSTNWRGEKAYRVFVAKPEKKTKTARP
jgi:hypothetical protein